MNLMLYFGGAYSQTNKNFKLYINASYKEYSADFINYKYSDQYRKTSEISAFNMGFVSLAYELKNKKGYYHEFSVTPIVVKSYSITDIVFRYSDSLTQAISGAKIIDFETSSSYQFNYSFNKKVDSKVEPYIGFGTNLFHSIKMLEPIVPNYYHRKTSVFGFGFSLIPAIKFKLNSKCSLDVNFPFLFYEFNSGKPLITEPISSENTKLSRNANSSFFPKKYYFRIGLTYNL